jgi:hypothetical protein
MAEQGDDDSKLGNGGGSELGNGVSELGNDERRTDDHDGSQESEKLGIYNEFHCRGGTEACRFPLRLHETGFQLLPLPLVVGCESPGVVLEPLHHLLDPPGLLVPGIYRPLHLFLESADLLLVFPNFGIQFAIELLISAGLGDSLALVVEFRLHMQWEGATIEDERDDVLSQGTVFS